MEAKPYSLQAPEAVAKQYGGDKMRIAQAMQQGIVDPTAGTLAGMFIDRMHNSTKLGQPPVPTVAQQVFAPAPPQPPAGLGALPGQQPPPGQPQMPPLGANAVQPPAPPAPPGMAAGGLASLNYDGGSYGHGGIVAFADGGESKSDRRKNLMYVISNPNSTSEERHDAMVELNAMDKMGAPKGPSRGLADILSATYEGPRGGDLLDALDTATGAPSDEARARMMAARNTPRITAGEPGIFGNPTGGSDEPSGGGGIDFDRYIPSMDTIKGLASRVGLGSEPDALAMADPARPYRTPTSEAAAPFDARSHAPTSMAAAPWDARTPDTDDPDADAVTPSKSTGLGASARARASSTRKPYTPMDVNSNPDETQEQTQARMLKMLGYDDMPKPDTLTPEDMAARKKEDMWTALAQIGFGTAASKSPFALQAIGEGASGAMPGIQRALDARRADEKDTRKENYAYQLSRFGLKGDAMKMALQEWDKASDNKRADLLLKAQNEWHQQEHEDRLAQIATSRAAIDKPTDMRHYSEVAARAQQGDQQAIRELAGLNQYMQNYGLAGGKLGLAQQVARTSAETKATAAVDKAIGLGGPLNREFRKLKGPAAERYRQDKIDAMTSKLMGTDAPSGGDNVVDYGSLK